MPHCSVWPLPPDVRALHRMSMEGKDYCSACAQDGLPPGKSHCSLPHATVENSGAKVLHRAHESWYNLARRSLHPLHEQNQSENPRRTTEVTLGSAHFSPG